MQIPKHVNQGQNCEIFAPPVCHTSTESADQHNQQHAPASPARPPDDRLASHPTTSSPPDATDATGRPRKMTKQARAPLWACPIGKPGSKPAPRLPTAPRTGLALYSAARGKLTKKPKSKNQLKDQYSKLTKKAKWLQGGAEALADRRRLLIEYHAEGEEDEEVAAAGMELANADAARAKLVRSQKKNAGNTAAVSPAATVPAAAASPVPAAAAASPVAASSPAAAEAAAAADAGEDKENEMSQVF